MTPAKVSIIIPCYNIAEHLSKCIESVLAQTYQDFELLLVNDGSTDNTLKIIEAFAEKDMRIKVFTHENKGVSYTRNVGIQNAKGNCIVFIDGDDVIKSDYLEKLISDFKETTWTICGMINVRKGFENENENFAKLLQRYPEKTMSKENLLDVLKHSSLSSPCARIYSKEIIVNHKVVFPENVSYQEDLLFNLAYCQHIQEIRLLDYFGYFYIEHSESSTSRYHQNFYDINILFEKLKGLVTNHEDEVYLQRFVLDIVLKKLANIFHLDSQLSKEEQVRIIDEIVDAEYFKFCQLYIPQARINPIFKLALKSSNKYILYFYLKCRFRN